MSSTTEESEEDEREDVSDRDHEARSGRDTPDIVDDSQLDAVESEEGERDHEDLLPELRDRVSLETVQEGDGQAIDLQLSAHSPGQDETSSIPDDSPSIQVQRHSPADTSFKFLTDTSRVLSYLQRRAIPDLYSLQTHESAPHRLDDLLTDVSNLACQHLHWPLPAQTPQLS